MSKIKNLIDPTTTVGAVVRIAEVGMNMATFGLEIRSLVHDIKESKDRKTMISRIDGISKEVVDTNKRIDQIGNPLMQMINGNPNVNNVPPYEQYPTGGDTLNGQGQPGQRL
jgi:hypothetical protein